MRIFDEPATSDTVVLRRPEMLRRSSGRTVVGGVLAGAFCMGSVAVTLSGGTSGGHVRAAVLHGVIVAVAAGVGLWASSRTIYKRFGHLLLAAGLLWSLATLAEADESVLYSFGRIAGWLVSVVAVYLLLSFPDGKLLARSDRALVGGIAAVTCLLYLPTALLVDAYPQQTPWALCRDSCPANALEVVAREPAILASVVLPLRAVLTVVLLAAVTVALTLRWRAASHLRRHMLAPVVLAALVTLISLTGFVVVRLAAPGSAAVDTLGWLYGLSIPVIALSFLIGLLRWRLFVARALRQLAAEVGAQSGPSILGAAFRKRMEDPTLRLLWWDGPTARWADSTGAPADLDHERALGHVATEARDHQGLPLIALVTDGAFRDNAEVRDTLMRYAMNSLEHRRLERRLDESMRELDESRARYASVAVAERRRIERDLHDGAQQRLVAVRIRLELAAEAMERNPHSGAGLVRELGDQIEQALDEVRSVAHSVYPSVLADCGLQDALRSQARHAALPVGLDASGVGRYPPEIESAVYFTCLEAMQNAAKHARGATRIAVSLRQGADLRFEIADDGAGLPAGYLEGVGIANMRDRMADVGGSMTLESLAGQGTTVTGTVPLRRSHD